MIYKEKLFIKRNIGENIVGNFYVDNVFGNRGIVRATDPGFVFEITINDDYIAKVDYQYIFDITEVKKFNGEFTIITDKEDIVIPYEIEFSDKLEDNIFKVDFENITVEKFIDRRFGEQFPVDSLQRILWEVYANDNVNSENIDEFLIAIGKKNRAVIEENIKYTDSNKKNSIKEVYVSIFRIIFNIITSKVSNEVSIVELDKIIDELRRKGIEDYKIKVLEYIWAILSDDTIKLDYIRQYLENNDINDEFYLSIFMFFNTININSYEKIKEAESFIEINAYKLNNSILFWLAYKLKQKANNNTNELYIWLKKIISLGSNSPFIYYELVQCIEKFDTAVLRLDTIEVTALYWAYKHDMLSDRLINYIIKNTIYLASYDKQLIYILKEQYYKTKDNNILAVICTLLIRGNRMEESSFYWYKKGVDNHVRITSLYEYFLYSIPKKYYEILPLEIYIYFKDNKMLSDNNKQILYANIIANKENISSIYDYYRKDMNAYMIQSLSEKRINDDLAVIYKEFELGIILDKQLSACILSVYCAYDIECRVDNVDKLIILQKRLSNPIEVWLINGKGQVRIPDNKFITIMVMSDGRKVFANNGDIVYRRIMSETEDVKRALKVADTHIVSLMESDLTTFETLVALNRKKWLRQNFQKDIQTKILRYAIINNEVGNYLPDINFDLIDNKIGLFNQYIKEGFYDIALKALIKLGFDSIGIERKRKIFYGFINNSYAVNEYIIYLALHLFKLGDTDEQLLKFLYEQNALTLLEEIEYYSTLKAYMKNYEFFEKMQRLCIELLITNDKFAPSNLYMILWERRKELKTQEMLEMLRRFSVVEDISEDKKSFIADELKKLVDANIYLPWFMRFKSKGVLPSELNDKVILMFDKPGYISYIYSDKKDSFELQLNNVIEGIYVVAIPMFYSDEIEYKLLDENLEPYTDSQKFKNKYIFTDSKYKDGIDRINDIIYSKENNYENLNELIGEYKNLKDISLLVFKPRV